MMVRMSFRTGKVNMRQFRQRSCLIYLRRYSTATAVVFAAFYGFYMSQHGTIGKSSYFRTH